MNITGVFTSCNLLIVSQALVSSAADVTGTMSSGSFPTPTTDGFNNLLFTKAGGQDFTDIQITLRGSGSGLVQLTGGALTMWSVSSSGGGGGGSSSSGSSPTPVTQEFGKPSSGTCDAAQPAGLDWAGVPSGGWANSWSQWMNGGNGGFVCTRTLVYSTTQATWVLA